MKSRLAELEKQVRQLSGNGTCKNCWGELFAVLLKDREDEGPRLQPRDADRLTPDVRCRGCGRAAEPLLLVTALSASLADDRMLGIAAETTNAGSSP